MEKTAQKYYDPSLECENCSNLAETTGEWGKWCRECNQNMDKIALFNERYQLNHSQAIVDFLDGKYS